MNKFNKYLYTFILSLVSVFVFMVEFKNYELGYVATNSQFMNFCTEFVNSFKKFDIVYVAVWIFMLYFYSTVYFDGKKYDKKSLLCSLMAVFFAVLTLVCKSYEIDNTLKMIYISYLQIFKSVIFLIGYYFIYYAIIKKVLNFNFDSLKVKKKNSFIVEKINTHPIITSFIIIGLLWLPYIIISFPGLSSGDTWDELYQFFHLEDSWSIDALNLINEDVYINKHHSVFHTVIMGSIYKLGKHLVSFTFGAFMYTMMQVILVLIIFSFMIKYMNKIKINNLIIFFSVLFLGLNPTIVTYAICSIKDTPNAIFNLLYVIFLLQIVRNYDSVFKNKVRLIAFIVTILLVLLLRNNGIYTFLLSFPFLFFVHKKRWKKICVAFVVPLIIFGIYDKVILPSYDVTEGSIKEVLSVPVLQLTRVIRHKPKEFSEQDKEIINKTFNFDSMYVLYNPNLSDDVKNLYNKDSTKEDLMDFFGIWFKYLKKYPHIYVESFVNSTYGYFFPERSADIVYLFNFKHTGTLKYPEVNLDVYSLPVFKNVRIFVNKLLDIYYTLPCFINAVAYYDWLLLFSCVYIINKKKYKYLVPLTPLLAVLMMCLVSPVNGSFRYILPIIFSTPIIISIDYLVYKECRK